MKSHRRNSATATGIAMRGIGLAVCAFLILSLIFAFVAYLSGNPTQYTGIFSIASVVLAFFIMGLFICSSRGEGGVLLSLICALAVSALLFAAELIIKRGSLSTPFLINCLCSVAACMVAAFLARKRAGRRKFRR